MIEGKGPNRIMKASSRTHQNQRGDPLFPRWRRGGTQPKRAKGIALSAVARKRPARASAKSLLPAPRAVAQPVLATPPKHILVPIDFSTQSTRALKSAVQVARRYAATITLVHVVEPIFYTHDYGYGPVRRQRPNEGLMRHVRQRLQVLRRRHVDTALTCKVVIKSGSAFDQIAKAAEELDADLIVMPTRGFTHHQPGEIGSTAERVVRHATCPVLTVRKPVLLGKRSKS